MCDFRWVDNAEKMQQEQAWVQRTDNLSTTALRKVATRKRDDHVWVADRTCVRNGEWVDVLRHEGEFTWVRASNGTEGYILTKFLKIEG